MKISESVVQFSSHHAAEEYDLFQQEESRTTIAGRNRSLNLDMSGRRRRSTGIWMDRVSISHRNSQEVRSEYNASLESSSRVSLDTGETVAEFAQKDLIEQLAGVAIDREVVVRALKRGIDIRLGTETSRGPETLSISDSSSTETLLTFKRTQVHYETEQMGFSSQGQVRTEDGRVIDFSLDMALDRMYMSRTEQETLMHTWQQEVNMIDPLVISLDGSVPELTDTRFEFDLDNDGNMEEVSFVARGSGFLSFDRNNDGVINNGSELFGPGTGNGFEELAAFDGDGNGWIDENDEIFSQLTVWTRDEEGNDQLVSLKDAGVGAIYLDNAQAEFNMTTMDNELKGQVRRSGVFLFENGNVGAVQQIDLAARTPEPEVTEVGPAQDMEFWGIRDRIYQVPETSLAGGEAPQIVENPLNSLMEQIKALREEFQELLGRRPVKEKNSRPSRLRAMATSLSDHQLYRQTHPDPLMLKIRSFQI
ncbi:MAG: hypothetical protein V6Z89_16155 [Desulfobacter sp.]